MLDLQFIKVSVRTDFRRRSHWREFDWGGEPIPKAKVELAGSNSSSGDVLASTLTDDHGWAALETSELADGNYTITITPENSRHNLAGPLIAEDPSEAPLPARMYHPLEIAVTLVGGLIADAKIDPGVRYAGLGNREQKQWPPAAFPVDLLPIDLKPIWIKSRFAGAAGRWRADDKIQMVVIHNTAADELPEAYIGPDINTFVPGTSEIHYAMDFNGHIIKFMRDHDKANHAGGRWKGQDPNDVSIGIELIHKEEKPPHRDRVLEYTDEQYASLNDFLTSLESAYRQFAFDRTRITGHSDVGTRIHDVAVKEGLPVDRLLLDGWRDQDPGQVFRWEKLEQNNWGLIPQSASLAGAYGDLFNLAEKVVLRNDDKDSTHFFGGKHRPDTAGTPIAELQQDLTDIGYSIKSVNGEYDNYTKLAVERFQTHFFSGSRRRNHYETGQVDKDTAQMIKNVRP
jgi:N-acetyl-anhydromuramyl-L-alanine amidase AmpD